MTEIALALAMGFFCILVLALVSMGAPVTANSVADADRPKAELLKIAAPSARASAEAMGEQDELLIFHKNGFLDAAGKPVDPNSLKASAGRLTLAFDPSLPLSKILEARARIVSGEVVLTPLDAAWQQALSTPMTQN